MEQRRKKTMAVFDAVRFTTRTLIKGTCRPTVTGLENVPTDGPFIVAPKAAPIPTDAML